MVWGVGEVSEGGSGLGVGEVTEGAVVWGGGGSKRGGSGLREEAVYMYMYTCTHVHVQVKGVAYYMCMHSNAYQNREAYGLTVMNSNCHLPMPITIYSRQQLSQIGRQAIFTQQLSIFHH